MGEVEVIAEVLAAHDWRWAIRDSRTGDGVRIACADPGCDWYADRADTDDVWAAHQTHVAEQVAARLAAADRDAGLRERIEAVVARMSAREVDHRHPDEIGHWGVQGRAYYYAGDVIDDITDLRAALDPSSADPTHGADA